MADVELDIELGGQSFRAKGPERWVDARLTQFLELGSAIASPRRDRTPAKRRDGQPTGPVTGKERRFGQKATRWMAQQKITDEMLDQVFYRDGDSCAVIADRVAAKDSNAQKVVGAYLLCGVAALLATDAGNFDDASARALCERHACFDTNNHTKNLKSTKTYLVGSKADGWKLTVPGLKAAGELVKHLAGAVGT